MPCESFVMSQVCWLVCSRPPDNTYMQCIQCTRHLPGNDIDLHVTIAVYEYIDNPTKHGGFVQETTNIIKARNSFERKVRQVLSNLTRFHTVLFVQRQPLILAVGVGRVSTSSSSATIDRGRGLGQRSFVFGTHDAATAVAGGGTMLDESQSRRKVPVSYYRLSSMHGTVAGGGWPSVATRTIPVHKCSLFRSGALGPPLRYSLYVRQYVACAYVRRVQRTPHVPRADEARAHHQFTIRTDHLEFDRRLQRYEWYCSLVHRYCRS